MPIENKDIFSKNLKYYMDKKGVDRNQLCSDLDLKYTTVRDWIKGITYPRIGKIELLANYFGINKSDLIEEKSTIPSATPKTVSDDVLRLDRDLYKDNHKSWIRYGNALLDKQNTVTDSKNTVEIHEEQAEYKSDKTISMEEYCKRVPVNVDFAASAGTGVCQEDNLDMEVMFYEDELAEDYDNVGIVMGSSMEPVLKNGDYIFVKITTDIPNGAISIWQVNGENYVKKFRSNGRPYLESLNPEYDDVGLHENDDIRPLGIVVDIYREN